MNVSLKRLRDQKEPFSHQLKAASNLVTISTRLVSHPPVIAANVKDQLLKWIEKLAKKPSIQQEGTKSNAQAVSFWSVVQFLLQSTTAASTNVVSVSPFLANSLCDMLLQALSQQTVSHELVTSIAAVFSMSFASSLETNTATTSVAFPLAPEKSIRFMAEIIKMATLKLMENKSSATTANGVKDGNNMQQTKAQEMLLTSVLAALIPALDNFTNAKKKFKLVVDLLLVQLLSLHHQASTSESEWGNSCTTRIHTILQGSLFSPTILESFDGAMPDTNRTSSSSSTSSTSTTATTKNSKSYSESRPKKRRKNSVQESKFVSFHRGLFQELIKVSNNTTTSPVWMSSLPALLQVFINANVSYMFEDTSSMSEHDRTRTVQRVGFKFFRELYNVVLPSTSTSTSSLSAKATSIHAMRLDALARMTELICRRNIFIRSNHGLGIEHKKVVQEMMERVNAVMSTNTSSKTPTSSKKSKSKSKSKKNTKVQENDNDTTLTTGPCIRLISLCVEMDHNFWKHFFSTWNPLLHTLAAARDGEMLVECVEVYVLSIQCFAKVRQLDIYMELICNVLSDASKTKASQLMCQDTFQKTMQGAVAECPAGQIEVLWNILHKELIDRMSNAELWNTMETMAIVYMFRSYCVSVNVARHNSVLLFNATTTLSEASMKHVVLPLLPNSATTSKKLQRSKMNENNVVLLESICILQERCQVFLPGNLRRSHQTTIEGHLKRQPSFLDGVAGQQKTIVPFLQKMIESSTSTTKSSTASNASSETRTIVSIKRLAIRRMFELHPLEASPGTLYKKQRKAARSELCELTTFVFDTQHLSTEQQRSSMCLIANNVELLCKYATTDHIDTFLKWLVDFDQLDEEEETQKKNNNNNNNARVEMLLKTSFYELRPIRDRLFHVMTHMLSTSIEHMFTNTACKTWLQDLKGTSVSKCCTKENASTNFFNLKVPKTTSTSQQQHVAQARNVLQLVLGLPLGYLQDDIDMTKFASLVFKLDILYHTVHSKHSIHLKTTRGMLAKLSSTHPDCMSLLLSNSHLLHYLLVTASFSNEKNTNQPINQSIVPAWIQSTMLIVENIAQYTYHEQEDKQIYLSTALEATKKLFKHSTKGTTTTISINAVTLLLYRVLEGIRNDKAKGTNKVVSTTMNAVHELEQDVLQLVDKTLVSDLARDTWWTSPVLVPGLLRLSKFVLICHQRGSLKPDCQIIQHMDVLLNVSMSTLQQQDFEINEINEKNEINENRISTTSIAMLDVLSHYCTLEHDDATFMQCLRMTLMLGTLIGSTSSATTSGMVFVKCINSTVPSRIAQILELLLENMAIAPSSNSYSMPAVVALQTLSDLMTQVKRVDYWHKVAKVASKTLNAVAAVNGRQDQDDDIVMHNTTNNNNNTTNNNNNNSTTTTTDTNSTTRVRAASLSVLLAMLRQPKHISMGTHELSFCLQCMTFWSEDVDSISAKHLATLTYNTLAAMLEYRPHALYSCASAYVLVTRSVLCVAQRQTDSTIRMRLMRYVARIFEEMAKETHRNALRHYCLYLLHEAITGVLEHGWPPEAKDDFQQGLYCLLDVCTEYQSQMLFVGLNESGRSLLRDLRRQHQAQHVWQ